MCRCQRTRTFQDRLSKEDLPQQPHDCWRGPDKHALCFVTLMKSRWSVRGLRGDAVLVALKISIKYFDRVTPKVGWGMRTHTHTSSFLTAPHCCLVCDHFFPLAEDQLQSGINWSGNDPNDGKVPLIASQGGLCFVSPLSPQPRCLYRTSSLKPQKGCNYIISLYEMNHPNY